MESVARKIVGDSRAQWYRLRGFTGVDDKIQGQKTNCISVESFVD